MMKRMTRRQRLSITVTGCVKFKAGCIVETPNAKGNLGLMYPPRQIPRIMIDMVIQATAPPTGQSASDCVAYTIGLTGTDIITAILHGTGSRADMGITVGMDMFPGIVIPTSMGIDTPTGIPMLPAMCMAHGMGMSEGMDTLSSMSPVIGGATTVCGPCHVTMRRILHTVSVMPVVLPARPTHKHDTATPGSGPNTYP
jgi:hypothetical protein